MFSRNGLILLLVVAGFTAFMMRNPAAHAAAYRLMSWALREFARLASAHI